MCANLHEDILKAFPFHAKQVQRNGIGEALSILHCGTRKVVGVGGKRQPPAAFLPGNEICYPFYKKLCEHWTILDWSRKSLLTGVQIQPLVSRALRYFRVSFHQCSILTRDIAFIYHRHFIIL